MCTKHELPIHCNTYIAKLSSILCKIDIVQYALLCTKYELPSTCEHMVYRDLLCKNKIMHKLIINQNLNQKLNQK